MTEVVTQPTIEPLDVLQGCYLKSPHGELIFDGRKQFIAQSQPNPSLRGRKVIVSKVDGHGWAFGIADIGDGGSVPVEVFDDTFDVHRVTKNERCHWWPDAAHIVLYPIESFTPYPTPVPCDVPPGTQLIMPEVKFIDNPDVHFTSAIDRDIISEVRERLEEEETESKGISDMPWTAEDADRFTESADTPKKRRQWAEIANSALARCMEGKSGEDARKKCEASAIRQANSVVGKVKGVDDRHVERLLKEHSKRALDDLQSIIVDLETDLKADTCTCPNCGTEADKDDDTPCNEQECPECGSMMRGGESEAEKTASTDIASDIKDAPTPIPDLTAVLKVLIGDAIRQEIARRAQVSEAVETAEPITLITSTAPEPELDITTSAKAGRRIQSSKLQALRDAFTKFKDFIDGLLSWGDYKDEAIDIIPLTTFKSLTDPDQAWLMLWVTNSYRDREGEIFRESALKDYTVRYADEPVKGEFWYSHVPGTKFGTVHWQAVVEDRFLVQLGTFDDTPIGHAFKAFFQRFPDGHPVFAPTGWGASHGYNYIAADRQDKVYDWLRIAESSVLPALSAANVYNPSPTILGGKQMNDKEIAELDTIGKEVNVDLVSLVTATAQTKKDQLDDVVEHKSVDAVSAGADKSADKPADKPADEDEPEDEQTQSESEPEPEDAESKTVDTGSATDQEPETDDKGTITQDALAAIAAAVAEQLDLKSLSGMFETILANQQTATAERQEVKERLTQLERADEKKVSERIAHSPRFSWMRASQVAETVASDAEVKVLSANSAKVPSVVKGIVGKIGG